MSVASCQLIIESIQRIIGLSKRSEVIPLFEIQTIIITVGTVGMSCIEVQTIIITVGMSCTEVQTIIITVGTVGMSYIEV